MPHEQEIFKHRYRETGKIAHSGGVRPERARAFVCLAGSGRAFFLAAEDRKTLPESKDGGNSMKLKARILDEAGMNRALMRIAHEILEHNKGAENLRLVGVRRRGGPIARHIADNILRIENREVPVGSIDIAFYRDDLSRLSETPQLRRTELPFDVDDRDVVLVDDVIYTGRTARAAIEAVFSCGRPRSIQLAELVDRGHRELPIRPDYVGKNLPTSRTELVEVRLPKFDGETGVFLMDTAE